MTFSPDVEQILREHGRDERAHSYDNRKPLLHNDGKGYCVVCLASQDAPQHADSRPTRQQIIQDAVRLWAKRHLNDAPEQYRKGDLEKFFGCCPEMQTEAEAALLRGDG